MIYKAVVPFKLPGLNEYVKACRTGPYVGAKLKKHTQEDIGWYLLDLPEIHGPVHINFTWTEKTRQRDFDNVAFAKKFILDELVQLHKLEDDSRRYVSGFTDRFLLGNEWSVEIEIVEDDNDRETTGSAHYPGYKGRSLRRRRPSAPAEADPAPAGGAGSDDSKGTRRDNASARPNRQRRPEQRSAQADGAVEGRARGADRKEALRVYREERRRLRQKDR